MNHRKVLILFLSLFITSTCAGDKLEKAFERLNVFDYFNAKQYFEKSMKDEPAASAYGLAKIFSVNNNPFYSIDSARKYIVISDSLYRIQKEKVKRYYREFGVTDSAISLLSESICDEAFSIARNQDSSPAYNHFIRFFNSCEQTEEVTELRDAAAFHEAEKLNTSDAFKSFMASYPQAIQIQKAHGKYDELIFKENTDSTIESYQFFLQNFPENPHTKQAERMIYDLSVPDKTLDQYAAFARKYRNSPFNKDAWLEVYKLGMPDFSEVTYNDFRKNFPDYPYPDELETDYKLQNTFFLPYSEGDAWGYMNDTGTVMIQPKYEEANFFREGLASVMVNNKYGYINKSGKVIIDFLFNDAEPFHGFTAVVMKDSLYGLIDKNGEFIIAPAFEELAEASPSIYMAVRGGLSGYIFRSGDKVTGFTFDVANDFRNGYAIISEDENYGLIDSAGNFVFKSSFEDLVFISDRFLKAMNGESWGIVTTDGDTVLPFDYDAIGEFSEGLALVAKNGKCGYIDESRREVIPLTFTYSPLMLTTGMIKDGFALLKQKTKSILIDKNGKAVKFKGVEDYGRPSEGFFPVRKNMKWGFADSTGKIIIPCKYQSAESFSGGLAIVRLKQLIGVIDTSGNEIIPPLYKNIILASKGIEVANEKGNGLFSRDGALIIPCEFEKIEFISDDIAKASKEENYQYINLNTGIVIHSSEGKQH